MRKFQKDKKQILSVMGMVLLVCVGVLSRTLLSRNYPHPIFPIFGNNYEVVTVIAILAGFVIGLRWGWLVPLSVMAISDLVLGNDGKIVIFTWTGFMIPALVGYFVRRISPKVSSRFVLAGVGGSLFSVLFFFVWTNFAVWLFWYPSTWESLMRCYTLAVPFLLNQLKGNLIVSSIVFGGIWVSFALFSYAKVFYAKRLQSQA